MINAGYVAKCYKYGYRILFLPTKFATFESIFSVICLNNQIWFGLGCRPLSNVYKLPIITVCERIRQNWYNYLLQNIIVPRSLWEFLNCYHLPLSFVVSWKLFASTFSNLFGEGANLVLKTVIRRALKSWIS